MAPQQPGNIPPYHPLNTLLQNKMIKQALQLARKHFKENQNMNKLLPNKYQLGYSKILTHKPNRILKPPSITSITNTGKEMKLRSNKNKEGMKKPWHPREGFQILKQYIQDGCTYAAFTSKVISNKDAFNMLMVIIAQTRLFAHKYQD